MTVNPDLPWSRINDYLVEIGSIRHINEFCLYTLSVLNELVPFDSNGIFGVKDASGRIYTRVTLIEASKWAQLYDNYYCKTAPDPSTAKITFVNWRDRWNTEFVTDFLNPQGIGCSISLFVKAMDNSQGGFALHRSKNSRPFNRRDRMILEVIQPHLSNFYAMLSLLNQYDAQLPDAAVIASDFKMLTRQEAEIAALLCRRFKTGMIASRLMISPITVYRHVANIFAKLNVFNRDELVEKLMSDYSGGKNQDG